MSSTVKIHTPLQVGGSTGFSTLKYACGVAHMLKNLRLPMICEPGTCVNTLLMHVTNDQNSICNQSYHVKQIFQPIGVLFPILPPVRICVWWPPTTWMSESITVLRVSSIASGLHRYSYLSRSSAGLLCLLIPPWQEQ